MLFENENAEVLRMVAGTPPPSLQITQSSKKTDAVRNKVSANGIEIYFYGSTLIFIDLHLFIWLPFFV